MDYLGTYNPYYIGYIYICITMSHPIYMDDRMKSGLVTKWDIYIYCTYPSEKYEFVSLDDDSQYM